MHLLEKLAERQTEWLKMAQSLGSKFPEDAVQDMYLLMHEQGEKGNVSIENYDRGQIAMYVYSTLRSIIFKGFAADKRRPEVYEEELLTEIKDDSDDYDIELDSLKQSVFEALQEMSAYDRGIVFLCIEKKISVRQVSRESGISSTSIYNTLNKIKKNVKQKTLDKYERKTGKRTSEHYDLEN